MKRLMGPVIFLLALCLQQAHADGANDDVNRRFSVSALKEQVAAPGDFTVAAYVVEKYDVCPKCPPNAVCETCVLGIYLADDNLPRKPGASSDDGIYLRTNRAQEFQVGSQYEFRIGYRMEKNAAGAWQRTGPELIDFAPVRP